MNQVQGGSKIIEQQGSASWLLTTVSLWRREVVRFLRQRSRIIGALGTPILFWILIGSGLGRSFNPVADIHPSSSVLEKDIPAHYMEYFFPGTMVLIVLFTAIFATISIIEDRREGFLQAVVAAPVRRSAIVLGKISGSTTLAVAQALFFLAFAPLAGIPLTLRAVISVALTLIVLSVGLSALGFLIAWSMDSTQGFHAIMNLFLMPMWMLSGALFPKTGASGWIGWIMSFNPLTYGLAAVRRALYDRGLGGVDALPSYSLSLAITACFAGIMVCLCTWMVTKRPNA